MALENVVHQIGSVPGALARARFIVSTRIGDWYTRGVPDTVGQFIGHTSNGNQATSVAPLVYSLNPLSAEDAKALAKFYGAIDANLFWREVERVVSQKWWKQKWRSLRD